MTYFESQAAFRRWLAKNHASRRELIVGFYRKDSGKGGLTYPEALDEALCIGWIDGVRRKVDAVSFSVRFTPRKAGSVWSAVNLRHVERLRKAGTMKAPGLRAFDRRDPARTERSSYERGASRLTLTQTKRFKSTPGAWQFFEKQAPFYQRILTWWVVSARREETRIRRLNALIVASAARRRLR